VARGAGETQAKAQAAVERTLRNAESSAVSAIS